MIVEPLGESAYILRNLPDRAYKVAAWLRAGPTSGIEEAVASYETIGLYVTPGFEVEALKDALDAYESRQDEMGRSHTIPVCYELGEDLEWCASILHLDSKQLIEAHSGQEYTCYALGFCPGFPYLGYLPKSLQGVPRLRQPRVKTPMGSVAITGSQTGIYPMETPGGWPIVGRTPLDIVSMEDGHFPISPGDKVHFAPISEAEFARQLGTRL